MKACSEDGVFDSESDVGVRMVKLDEVEGVHKAEEGGGKECVLIAGGVCVSSFVSDVIRHLVSRPCWM